MRVTAVETFPELHPPRERPIRDALQVLSGGGNVTVRISTDDGLVGEGSAFFGRIRGAVPTLKTLIDEEIAPVVVGRDPLDVRAIHADLKAETEYHGWMGLTMFGIAAVDIALWDLVGKAAGLPCRQLWGARADRIPAYAMVGWLNYEVDELRAVCARAVDHGFRALKLKVGAPTLDEDVTRIEAVRAEVGPGIRLMVDANQVHALPEAIRRGRAYEHLGCAWYEEPLPARDYEGYRELAAALDISVATGENLYGIEEFRELIARRGCDLVQPDPRRAGGPTEIMSIAGLATGHGLPWASHTGGPVMLSLLCSLPGGSWLESGVNPGFPILEDGCALAPQGPGFAWE